MDTKTLQTLEYPKVLAQLASHCDFSASAELARALEPTPSLELATAQLQETSEARRLFSQNDLTIGGAHDIRRQTDLAARGGILEPSDLLDIKNTLIACRDLKKSLEKHAELFPRLNELSFQLPNPLGLVDAISRVISDRGDVLDSASPKLASLRKEMRVAHDRLMTRLQKYISDPKTIPMLQDTLITSRDGRYVIPLRAEFKGQIKSIVHDQSSSGATLFIEPIAIVELNNTYKELQLAERNEIIRVLTIISATVGDVAQEIINGIEALAYLDLIFAKAKYANELSASEPVLLNSSKKQKETTEPQPAIHLLNARHPLINPQGVVPNHIDLKPGTRAMVITGPNTGGKTVTLKTVGLLVLMAQSGLHIPAQSGSQLPVFENVFADIGDEQSIEQSLSTFSSHITNIIRTLKKINARSLVIFDELGAGTDPQEGAALARAILQHLLETGCTTLIATHYPELKTFAHSTEGVVNASLEFDVASLRPTYKLTIGLPGRSNALAIASRLGLPESIISYARAEINPSELRADKLLDDIRKERNRTSREREKSEKARKRTEAVNQELEARLAAIEEERRQVVARAHAEAELEVEILKSNLESLKREMKKLRQPIDALTKLEEKIEKVEQKITGPVERNTTSNQTLPVGNLKLGEKVILKNLGSEGIVSALGQNDVEVQIGSLRVRAKLNEIARKGEQQPEAEITKKPAKGLPSKENKTQPAKKLNLQASPGLELDLRGQRAEDALEKLEKYLDQAYVSGMPYVRVIHGKGTGKLRQEVRAAMQHHPHVSSYEEGLPNEGGDGVTVAKIKGD